MRKFVLAILLAIVFALAMSAPALAGNSCTTIPTPIGYRVQWCQPPIG